MEAMPVYEDEDNVNKNEIKSESAPVGSVQNYELKNNEFISTFITASYINDTLIAFEYDQSEAEQSSIGLMNRGEKTFNKIYDAPNKKIINSLVGVKDNLYWVEYNRSNEKKKEWEIKTLHLDTKQVKVVDQGYLDLELQPPVLRMEDNKVTWIKKTIEDKIITSSLIVFDPIKGKMDTIASEQLNDQMDQRDGIFMVLQRPLKEGILVQQTSFNKESASIDEKQIEIVYYPYDFNEKPEILKEGTGVVDFTADDKWFVWTEIGKLYVADKNSGEIKHIIEAQDKDLTLDTPFIRGNKLYYRYSMYQIFSLDLESGKVLEISSHQLTTSKLFNSESYLGFSVMDPLKYEGEAQLNVIELN